MNVRKSGQPARAVRFEFSVSGSLPFPLDMLRYEGAYPASAADVAEIDESIARNDPDRRRTVNLVAVKATTWLPTQARWHSFSWRVE